VFTVSRCLHQNVKVHRKSFNIRLFLDGHGGSIVAKYASKHLHKFIIQRPEFPSDIPEALKQVSDNLTAA
jgi:Protein phosphatase 2C